MQITAKYTTGVRGALVTFLSLYSLYAATFLCRLFELRSDDGLKLKSSVRMAERLKGVGEQNCLVFSNDGTRFAAGGEVMSVTIESWRLRSCTNYFNNAPFAHLHFLKERV